MLHWCLQLHPTWSLAAIAPYAELVVLEGFPQHPVHCKQRLNVSNSFCCNIGCIYKCKLQDLLICTYFLCCYSEVLLFCYRQILVTFVMPKHHYRTLVELKINIIVLTAETDVLKSHNSSCCTTPAFPGTGKESHSSYSCFLTQWKYTGVIQPVLSAVYVLLHWVSEFWSNLTSLQSAFPLQYGNSCFSTSEKHFHS